MALGEAALEGSVNKHFHAMHGALNIVSGGGDECGETEGSNQPGFALRRRKAAAAAVAGTALARQPIMVEWRLMSHPAPESIIPNK